MNHRHYWSMSSCHPFGGNGSNDRTALGPQKLAAGRMQPPALEPPALDLDGGVGAAQPAFPRPDVPMECMHQKEAKGHELMQTILQWEVKWNQMMKDQPGGTSVPELWRTAVLMKMCPKEIKHNIESSWGTIDENVVMWATNAAE